MDLKFSEYVRKPFVVEAIEITPENIEEIAKFVGTLHSGENGTKYITPNQHLVPNANFSVYPGFYMTRMNGHIRLYSRKIFRKRFVEQTAEKKEIVDILVGD